VVELRAFPRRVERQAGFADFLPSTCNSWSRKDPEIRHYHSRKTTSRTVPKRAEQRDKQLDIPISRHPFQFSGYRFC
jgi:hypothetical protein